MAKAVLSVIMRRAHQLAKQMEGDYQARMSLGLRTAWAEYNKRASKMAAVEIGVNHQPSGGKEWVAEIDGFHPKYKFNRGFLSAIRREWSCSGKTGNTYFQLEAGKVYEINEPWKGRRFVKVQDGKVVEISRDEVEKQVAGYF